MICERGFDGLFNMSMDLIDYISTIICLIFNRDLLKSLEDDVDISLW